MNTFDYFRESFRSDLEKLFRGDPIIHHLPIRLDALPPDHRPHFVACLFTQVLADQVVHSYFGEQHAAYEHASQPAKMVAGLAAGYPHHVLEYATRGYCDWDELIGPLFSACVLMCSECDRVFQELVPKITLDSFRQALLADKHVMRWSSTEALPVLRVAHAAIATAFDSYGYMLVTAMRPRGRAEHALPQEAQPHTATNR